VPAPARPLPIAERFSAAFAGRLQELRWIEGRTVTIEYRWSEGRLERVAEIAAEFVRLKVDRRVWKRRRHVKASDGFHPHGLSLWSASGSPRRSSTARAQGPEPGGGIPLAAAVASTSKFTLNALARPPRSTAPVSRAPNRGPTGCRQAAPRPRRHAAAAPWHRGLWFARPVLADRPSVEGMARRAGAAS
jgi:hypothetical protein